MENKTQNELLEIEAAKLVKKKKKTALLSIFLGVGSILTFLLVWDLLCRFNLVSDKMLVSPITVIKEIMVKFTDNRKVKVQVNNLSKSFGTLEVLKDCNFSVKDGEFLCVVGPTGCGKTTFLNLLSNLIEPTSGEVLIDGEKASPQKHNLSFIFQEPSALPWLTVEDNIKYGMKAKIKDQKYIQEQADRIIGLMGLEKYRKSFPGEMSTSAEQRIVIGRAFAVNPDLLLMDEPYGQMDIKTRFYLEDEVIRIWREFKRTVIFITHNIEEAVYLAERVLVLTNKPAKVKEEINIDLPRPRDIASPEFVEIRNHITELIRWW